MLKLLVYWVGGQSKTGFMIQRLLNFFKRRPTASAQPAAFRQATGEPVVLDRQIPRADLDPDAVKILQRLTRYRHQAFLVGGCVRDLLLGLKPKDFDIGTSATPRQIKRLFRNSRIIGRRFRLAHVYFRGGKLIEVATFRALDRDDDTAEDGDDSEADLMIRDDNQFGSPSDDALRRDFTINQLFYDLEKGHVIDHAGGLEDLEKRLVRTIGDPVVRFREDPIRILRAIKFAARLDLNIEATTLEALRKTKSDIPRAAPPRVLEEINRFCQGGKSQRSFELLFEYGVMEVILPEISALYGSDDRCRTLLLELLTKLDAETARGNVPQTGEILALLLLPGMRKLLGWSDSGEATQPRGVQVRDAIDERLRPLAIRLRVSRRDQEHCRQIIMMLFRMVPHDRIRRGTLRGIVRRTAYPSALWIVAALADSLGGQFVESASFWAQQKPERPTREEQRRDAREDRGDSDSDGDGDRPRNRRSRRGRRGGRRRRGEGRGETSGRSSQQGQDSKREGEAKSSAPPRKPGRDGWDEDYFFSALPTVPEMEDDGQPNRYSGRGGGSSEGAANEPETSPERPQEGDEAESPRPRRRRRRRRGRRGAGKREENSTPEQEE